MNSLQAASVCGALALSVTLGGCSGSSPSDSMDGGTKDQGTVVIPGTPVNGTDSTTYLTDKGPQVLPNDLTQYTISALVPTVTGSFLVLNGQGSANGTFTIPNVPAGTYYLQYGYPGFPNNFLITSSHQVDFSSDTIGRPDVAFSSATTTLSPSLTALTAWGKKDHVELLSSNAGAFAYDLEDPTTPVAAGATSLMVSKLPYTSIVGSGTLIDGTKGDSTYVYQLSTRMSANVGPYTGLANSLPLPTFAMMDAKDNPLTGALTPVTQTMFSTHLAVSQFEKVVKAGTASATISGTYLLLESTPGGIAHGPFSTTADLLEVSLAAGTADTDTGMLSYGNPFPSSWGTYANVITGFSVSYALNGLASPLVLQGSAIQAVDVSTLTAAGMTPPVGAVQNLKVNGKPAVGLLNVSTTPSITFDPPATGTAHSYLVTLAAITVTGTGMPGTAPVAVFRTQGTSILVPPGVLQSGGGYVVSVVANYSPNDSFDAPLFQHFPQGSVTAFSGVLLP